MISSSSSYTYSLVMTVKPICSSSSSSSSPKPSFVLLPKPKPKPKAYPFVVRCASNINNKKKKNKKDRRDSHSFIPKPDEATGPFPEAVLLKQKKVEKDGELFPEFADDDEERVYQILKLQLQDDDFQDQRLRHYEVVYLIHEKHADQLQLVNDQIQAFLGEKRGKIWRISDWGMRRLAYKIQKAKNAHYFLMNFEMDAKWINDFKMMLDKDERVIRHLVMKRDEAITKDCPPPPEFHSMRAGIDDDDELDDDDEDTDDDDDENENENEIEDEGDVIFLDEDEVDEDDSTTTTNDATSTTRINKTRAEKVAR